MPSLLYGLVSVGCTLETVKLLSSTISRHLRKVLRIHEHGVSNQDVLQQAGIDLWDDLGRRFQTQQKAIQLDSGRSIQLRQREGTRAEHLLQQFLRVQEVGQSRLDSLLLKNIPDAVSHPCPVCGVYFGTKSGLEQHIHKKHPELEKQAQIVFDRSKHCLYGTPTCRFCRQRLTDWQSMRKHLTQGMCPTLKSAFAQGKTLDHVLAEVIGEEDKDPPPPPAAEWKQENPLLQSHHEVLTVPNHRLVHYAEFIKSCTGQCVLCRQRIAGPGHIKTHWRTGHSSAWRRTSAMAESLAGSMSSAFCSPCQFCGSQAKDSRAHSRKCPSFFQIAAARQLYQEQSSHQDYAYQQPIAQKQDKSNPQYLTYVAPIQRALQGKIISTGTLQQEDKASITSVMPVPKSRQDGTIRSFFAPSQVLTVQPSNDTPALPDGPWQCRIRLANPHNICYTNAGFLAMTYALQCAGIALGSLEATINLAGKAADKGVSLRLTQSHRFRQLLPNWVYDEVQRDTAEYVQQLLQAQPIHSALWDARKLTLAGLQLRAQGDIPIPMPIPHTARDLQDIVYHWHQAGDVHAFAHSTTCICLQLNRYIRQGHVRKLTTAIRFDRPVFFPRFTMHLQTTWDKFQVVAAIVHLGRTTQSGHYRSLLKVGAQWMYTDDSCFATSTDITAEHEANVYVLWLQSC